MYIVNRGNKSIKPTLRKSFKDFGFSERNDLQEWIVNDPSSLGEDILIIQKEFSGFDGTNERLDLLAIDKDGNLVIIENKLDDSGRDVSWQALKYVAYCSTLTQRNIIEIYQKYLNDYVCNAEQSYNAEDNICEFLECDADDMQINIGNSQRIILVAAQFRKEVTSVALWLLNKDIDVRCFKVTPYTISQEIVVNFEQIIPTPESSDFMIKMREKNAEEKKVDKTSRERHSVLFEYWSHFLDIAKSKNITLLDNISPMRKNYIIIPSSMKKCTYAIVYNKKRIGVELYIDTGDREKNKDIFDAIQKHQEGIERDFNDNLEWQRLQNKRACRVQFVHFIDSHNLENLDFIMQWQLEHIVLFHKALDKALEKVKAHF